MLNATLPVYEMNPGDHGAKGGPLRFMLGSWFLYDSFAYCTQPGPSRRLARGLDDEWMHYATGIVVGDVRTIERIVTFPFAKQSPGFVRGEPHATRDVLIQMAERGYGLHAVLHSHPGNSLGGTHPSHTDLDHQARMERGGYRVISGIYSRDGFVRFFSIDLHFEIEIYGDGVERLSRNTFHLADVQPIATASAAEKASPT